MASFAKINENNIVERVARIDDSQEHRGNDHLNENGLIGTWIQTSVNTRNGIHSKGGTPLRKNYAIPGYKYDHILDAFIPPKPQSNPSWVVDEKSGQWVPPIAYPQDRKNYKWDEPSVSWVIASDDVIPNSWVWDSESANYYSWVKRSFWIAPVAYPNDGNRYEWDENIINWKLISGSLSQ